MGENVLNTNTKFGCNCSIGPSMFSIVGSNTCEVSLGAIATSTMKLMASSILPCQNQPNPSGAGFLPCNPGLLSQTWMNINSNLTYKNMPTLTSSSNMMCGMGGILSPISSTIQKKVIK